VVGTTVASDARRLATLTVNRTGYWAAAGHYHVTGGSQEGAGHDIVAEIRFAGGNAQALSMGRDANTNQAGVGVFTGHVLLSNGQVIELWGYKGYSSQVNLDKIQLRAYFMPTSGYPG